MSLAEADFEKKEKIYTNVKKFGPLVTVISYIAGIVYFCMLPHELLVHGTYMSESSLLPGLVRSDIYSTELLYNTYDLLKNSYETKKVLDFEIIKNIFENQLKLETYIQNFNITNPFLYDLDKKNTQNSGKNVYAFGRAQRADGTESVVITAPAFLTGKKNKQIPNLVGIAQLFMMAQLAKTRPYWSKDLIFVVTDVGQYGMQAWINSYFETESEYIKGDNLNRRGGSIQAALNLEFKDINVNKLEIKLEGANGKLPNLDLFNTIIRVCKSNEFECSLESEKSSESDYSYYQSRPPVEFQSGIINTFRMMFKQASGIPSSIHGYFLNHRIEALTISGSRSVEKIKQHPKQNLLKATKIIESTLRSVNNLMERFHQSFFFYLLPSSHYYISIGMYMPAFGLVVLPILIHVLTLWFSIFFKKPDIELKNTQASTLMFDLFCLIIPKILVSAAFGVLFYFGTWYFLYFGKLFNLNGKDSLLQCYITVTINMVAAPLIINLFSSKISKGKEISLEEKYIKETGEKFLKIIILLSIVIFLGTLSLLNFSFAFLTALFYVPVSVMAIQTLPNKLLKLVQLILVLIASPIVYFTILFLINSYLFENSNLFIDMSNFIQLMGEKFYELVVISKISGIWTYDLVNLCLIPIWASLWFISFPKFD